MYNSNSNFDPQYQDAYKRAERRVQAKLGFYWHLSSYVIVNGVLIIIYLLTGGLSVYPWFVWPMFGWGIGLLFHFLGVFVFSSSGSEDARRRMIEEEMRRMGVSNSSVSAGGYNSNPYSSEVGGFPPAPGQPGSGPVTPDKPG